MGKTTKENWLENLQYQKILRLIHTIAFEFNLRTGAHSVSPFISETLAGRYDERPLSQVMLEDGVLHPDDFIPMIAFRDRILAGQCGSDTVVMRLKTKAGAFRWYRMSTCIGVPGKHGDSVVVGTITDVHEEQQLREKQRQQAQYDEVTGIYNKATFYLETERLVHLHRDWQYSLVLFDVVRFKMVNELFGIQEGDQLLRFIGTIVARCVVKEETYGRIRDDVFCLCVHRSDAQIGTLTEELRLAISNFPISFSLTLSVGIYRIEEADLPVSIMCDRASMALRTVKNCAVDSFAFYRPELGRALAQEQEILGQMQNGIRTGQFEVYYQPKHHVTDGALIGAEALVRWIHPKKGMIPPVEFIGLFERNGLIMRLDEYVWESVCQSLRDWIDRGFSPPPISVNVSRVHLYDPNLCDKFMELTQKYNLPPALLEIELTESAYVENPRLGELMRTLQGRGFTFLMDDFGSGYSSLNMLRNIPVDILKLDLHFLGFDEGDASGQIIMESVIRMAQRLKIPIIAEGVETAGQAMLLRKAGCTMAQGFFYSRPMPRAEYECGYLQGNKLSANDHEEMQ